MRDILSARMNASCRLVAALLLATLASAAPSQGPVEYHHSAVESPRSYPYEYVQLGEFGKYRASHDQVRWGEAVQACQDEGSYLLVLRSQDELDALHDWAWIPNWQWYGALPNGTVDGKTTYLTVQGEPLEGTGYNDWAWDPDAALQIVPDATKVLLSLSFDDESDLGPYGVGLMNVRDDNEYYICKKDVN